MKKLILIVPFMALVMIFSACSNDNDTDPTIITLEKQIEDLKVAIAPYTNLNAAIAAGYDNNSVGYISHMGDHYYNISLGDANFELKKPEVLLFDQDGVFVGVEYFVPIIGNNNDPAPKGFIGDEDEWHKSELENFWELHVWVGLDNPNGIFAEFNPKLP